MRIAYDVSCLRGALTGVGYYARNLLEALQRVASDHDYIPIRSPQVSLGDGSGPWLLTAGRRARQFAYEHWQLPGQLQREKIDLYHNPAFHLPCCAWLRSPENTLAE